MASVVTLELSQNSPQGTGERKIQYKFTLLDNFGKNYFFTYPPKVVPTDYDTDAELLLLAPQVLASKAEQEQADLRERAIAGEIVLHDDQGGFYTKKTLLWDTWDNHTTSFLKYFLSLTWQLDILSAKQDTDLITSNDLKALLDITNQNVSAIRGDMQIALDTTTSLNNYTPYYDEDGTWIG